MENSNHYYLISHLVLASGLSDRTIRSHIAAGFLQGEKINGLWHFTPEQVENFFRHPAVRPGILAKQNAAVYDFLLNGKKESRQSCVILDLAGAEQREVAEFFCYRISNGDFRDIRFSFDGVGDVPRVILSGDMAEVLRLMSDYSAQYPSET